MISASKYKVGKWLQRKEHYNLQRPLRRNYRRNNVVSTGIDDQSDADLMDITKFKMETDSVQFVLLVIDSFSKYIWMRPLKDKKGPTTAQAFEDMLHKGRRPRKLRTDKGQEFRTKPFNNVLTNHNIKHFILKTLKWKPTMQREPLRRSKLRCIVIWHSSNPNAIFVISRNLLGATTRHITALSTPNQNWFNQTTKKKCAYLHSFHGKGSKANNHCDHTSSKWVIKYEFRTYYPFLIGIRLKVDRWNFHCVTSFSEKWHSIVYARWLQWRSHYGNILSTKTAKSER